MSVDKLPADVRKLIEQAVRLAEAERLGPPQPVVVEDTPDGESGLENLKAIVMEAGFAKGPGATADKPKQKPGKPPTVNQRMLEMLQEDPDRLDWSAQQWAEKLAVSATAVKLTAAWRESIKKARALMQADRPRQGKADRKRRGK